MQPVSQVAVRACDATWGGESANHTGAPRKDLVVGNTTFQSLVEFCRSINTIPDTTGLKV